MTTTKMTELKKTLPEIEPGKIVILFRTGSYDGMVTGVGRIGDQHVYLDASEQRGGWELKSEWQALRDQLEALLDGEDSENIWDRIERKYEKVMDEDVRRCFLVYPLEDQFLRHFQEEHRKWQLHVGLNVDFFYDNEGRPRHAHGLMSHEESYWNPSDEYIKAHIWDQRPSGPYMWHQARVRDSTPLGWIWGKDVYAPSPHRIPWVTDPRSPELKEYQRTWKSGDPVRLDW